MRIVLLREEETNDRYKSLFQQHADISITQIPVLDFALCNLQQLATSVDNFSRYSGFVLTSKRGVGAFKQVLSETTKEALLRAG